MMQKSLAKSRSVLWSVRWISLNNESAVKSTSSHDFCMNTKWENHFLCCTSLSLAARAMQYAIILFNFFYCNESILEALLYKVYTPNSSSFSVNSHRELLGRNGACSTSSNGIIAIKIRNCNYCADIFPGLSQDGMRFCLCLCVIVSYVWETRNLAQMYSDYLVIVIVLFAHNLRWIDSINAQLKR